MAFGTPLWIFIFAIIAMFIFGFGTEFLGLFGTQIGLLNDCDLDFAQFLGLCEEEDPRYASIALASADSLECGIQAVATDVFSESTCSGSFSKGRENVFLSKSEQFSCNQKSICNLKCQETCPVESCEVQNDCEGGAGEFLCSCTVTYIGTTPSEFCFGELKESCVTCEIIDRGDFHIEYDEDNSGFPLIGSSLQHDVWYAWNNGEWLWKSPGIAEEVEDSAYEVYQPVDQFVIPGKNNDILTEIGVDPYHGEVAEAVAAVKGDVYSGVEVIIEKAEATPSDSVIIYYHLSDGSDHTSTLYSHTGGQPLDPSLALSEVDEFLLAVDLQGIITILYDEDNVGENVNNFWYAWNPAVGEWEWRSPETDFGFPAVSSSDYAGYESIDAFDALLTTLAIAKYGLGDIGVDPYHGEVAAALVGKGFEDGLATLHEKASAKDDDTLTIVMDDGTAKEWNENDLDGFYQSDFVMMVKEFVKQPRIDHCTVTDFELPQDVTIAEEDIAIAGDPDYLVYYQALPLTVDTWSDRSSLGLYAAVGVGTTLAAGVLFVPLKAVSKFTGVTALTKKVLKSSSVVAFKAALKKKIVQGIVKVPNDKRAQALVKYGVATDIGTDTLADLIVESSTDKYDPNGNQNSLVLKRPLNQEDDSRLDTSLEQKAIVVSWKEKAFKTVTENLHFASPCSIDSMTVREDEVYCKDFTYVPEKDLSLCEGEEEVKGPEEVKHPVAIYEEPVCGPLSVNTQRLLDYTHIDVVDLLNRLALQNEKQYYEFQNGQLAKVFFPLDPSITLVPLGEGMFSLQVNGVEKRVIEYDCEGALQEQEAFSCEIEDLSEIISEEYGEPLTWNGKYAFVIETFVHNTETDSVFERADWEGDGMIGYIQNRNDPPDSSLFTSKRMEAIEFGGDGQWETVKVGLDHSIHVGSEDEHYEIFVHISDQEIDHVQYKSCMNFGSIVIDGIEKTSGYEDNYCNYQLSTTENVFYYGGKVVGIAGIAVSFVASGGAIVFWAPLIGDAFQYATEVGVEYAAEWPG